MKREKKLLGSLKPLVDFYLSSKSNKRYFISSFEVKSICHVLVFAGGRNYRIMDKDTYVYVIKD